MTNGSAVSEVSPELREKAARWIAEVEAIHEYCDAWYEGDTDTPACSYAVFLEEIASLREEVERLRGGGLGTMGEQTRLGTMGEQKRDAARCAVMVGTDAICGRRVPCSDHAWARREQLPDAPDALKVAFCEYLLRVNREHDGPFIPPTAIDWLGDGLVDVVMSTDWESRPRGD